MVQVIDCKKLSNEILENIKNEAETFEIKPKLVCVVVGNDEASRIYIKRKQKACDKCGIISDSIFFNENISENELINEIQKLNNDSSVNAILVQLPLPNNINKDKIFETISPIKDVDCFNPYNVGKFFIDTKQNDILKPCTVDGCIAILDSLNVDFSGKKAVILGRSNIVGKPLIPALLDRNCSVLTLHSKSKNLIDELKTADIIISAIGKPKFIKNEFVKEDTIIIDVGINRIDDGTICGDCDFENVKDKCSFITPVPGGVGLMTVACLLKNTILCYKKQL